ncbi:hypothetical protein BS47DRAFT_1349693 [Hydnum rufescens UP504]|uniref:Uncharacterized protein n=1 Tax=Hydnum rufescens UP504 TaxID=1448309 RepID=A0A9P6AP29_9AGAM|nr:hypothetical protein BS47DRAFT_1349693 [Hydnum rufescens UP504]
MTGLATVTHSELQQYMLKLIREHGRVDMREEMVRIWSAVVKCLITTKDRRHLQMNIRRDVPLWLAIICKLGSRHWSQ